MPILDSFDIFDPQEEFRKLWKLANGEDASTFTDEDMEKYATIKSQYNQLAQPQQVGKLYSSFNPNNPYSIDTRGIMSGIESLTNAFLEKRRQEKLNGNPKEAKRYAEEADKVKQALAALQDAPNAGIKRGELERQYEDLIAKSDQNKGIATELLQLERKKAQAEKYQSALLPYIQRSNERLMSIKEQRKRDEDQRQFQLKRDAQQEKSRMDLAKFNQEELNKRSKANIDAQRNRGTATARATEIKSLNEAIKLNSGLPLADMRLKNAQRTLSVLSSKQDVPKTDLDVAKEAVKDAELEYKKSKEIYANLYNEAMKKYGLEIPRSILFDPTKASDAEREAFMKVIHPHWNLMDNAQRKEAFKQLDSGGFDGYLDNIINQYVIEPQPLSTTEQIDMTDIFE